MRNFVNQLYYTNAFGGGEPLIFRFMETIYAHSCSVKLIDLAEVDIFLAANGHLRPTKSKSTALGLFYEDRLCGVAQFSAPREDSMKKTHTRELSQLLFSEDVRVIGGATKLVKHYMVNHSPADFFFYEDISDESQESYSRIGMSLVNGKIKGDRFYEWVNPDRTHYTYKITATNSSKYYYGVSHVKKADASMEDCLNDGYWGSGGKLSEGNKFNNWKEKHSEFLEKEVLNRFVRAKDAYEAELLLIGNLYMTDPLCLNSTMGGRDGGIRNDSAKLTFSKDFCIDCQLERTFRGETCLSCAQKPGRKNDWCQKCEASTLHFGGLCRVCLVRRSLSKKLCTICNEETVHKGKTCTQCVSRAQVSKKWCPTCLKATSHQGPKCSVCISRELVSIKECPKHGFVTHQGDKCSVCTANNSVKTIWCDTCKKETKSQGGKCNSCSLRSRIKVNWCEKCQADTKHNGISCYVCASKATTVFCKTCSKETLHNGRACIPCSPGPISIKDCSACNSETKHRGSKCLPCQSKEAYYECQTCQKITRHKKGGICYLCERRSNRKAVSKEKFKIISSSNIITF